jgi:hypothetical protein
LQASSDLLAAETASRESRLATSSPEPQEPRFADPVARDVDRRGAALDAVAAVEVVVALSAVQRVLAVELVVTAVRCMTSLWRSVAGACRSTDA